MSESAKALMRETIYARSEWHDETERLREAVDNDDEELAVLLVRRILQARREEAQEEAQEPFPAPARRKAATNGSTATPGVEPRQGYTPRMSQNQLAAQNGRSANERVTSRRTSRENV
jgi:hypothetical protein